MCEHKKWDNLVVTLGAPIATTVSQKLWIGQNSLLLVTQMKCSDPQAGPAPWTFDGHMLELTVSIARVW